MNKLNMTQVWALVVVLVVIIAAAVWMTRSASAQEAGRFAFAGWGICTGDNPKYQCTPYFKPDRCNPATGNWVNASTITCPPDAWNDKEDTRQPKPQCHYGKES
jgi:hypothetical protein